MATSSERRRQRAVPKAWGRWLVLTGLVPLVFLVTAIVVLANGFGILFPWVWTVAGTLVAVGLPAGAAIALRSSA